jgi:hypothetical protein
MSCREAARFRARLISLVHQTQQGAHFLKRESESPGPKHEAEAAFVRPAIAPIAAGCSRWRRQQTNLLIVAHRFEIGARPARQLGSLETGDAWSRV